MSFMLELNFDDNSSEALWHFAIIAASGDEHLSKTETGTLLSSVSIIEKLITKIAKIQGSSSKDISKRFKKYITQIDSNLNGSNLKISASDIEFISNKITLISLQPVAIALAIVVAGSDGLPESEKNLIVSQKEEWDCDESEISDYIKLLKSN